MDKEKISKRFIEVKWWLVQEKERGFRFSCISQLVDAIMRMCGVTKSVQKEGKVCKRFFHQAMSRNGMQIKLHRTISQYGRWENLHQRKSQSKIWGD